MQLEISVAESAQDYAEYACIIEEYVRWCKDRFSDDVWFVNEVFGHQSLVTELVDLPSKYGPPLGLTLIARFDGEVCGGGAYRRLSAHVCEMKRLFVADRFKGKGFGRSLCNALIDAARGEGYRLMRLDTAHRLTEAIAMYRSLGFESCPAYLEYPDTLLPYLVFMERTLTSRAPR